ncbi:hypothetical protein CICLE_v10018375mg [Citrus x clementina]|uniref:Uncharacterized protein n=2 Tax=Citrus TaxID=2706 RepID=A0A067D7H3_CITSI|nr:hypothetical protein CICLE_v10018375mg [Citrus x clementina]KDO38748.1 hypothetical protein CISIN_1g039349mg [Citrus sinensis]
MNKEWLLVKWVLVVCYNCGRLKRKLCGSLIEMIDTVRYILETNGISFRTRSSKKLNQPGNLDIIYAL